MNTHADKTQENKTQSVSAASSQRQNGSESTFQFVDNRSEAIKQRKLKEILNNSPQVSQLRAFGEMANNSQRTNQVAQLKVMATDHSFQQQQPIQKKENNTGLPDNLKTGIENLSGYSMNDVKVHYNSDKPAQLNAHAYAQGTDIHLASGQDKHLPHEAWHVVQQKQGRVKPTRQMKGKVDINDDVELEKEADIMGEKSLSFSGEMPNASRKKPVKQTKAVQRKMGFEFEAGRNKLLDFERKDVAYQGSGFTLESDTGNNTEFVTSPFDNWTDLRAAISNAASLAGSLVREAIPQPDNIVTKNTGDGWKRDNTRIRVNDNTFNASVQLTEGVQFEDVLPFIREHLGDDPANAYRDQTEAINNAAPAADTSAAVKGLIQVIVMYIQKAQAHKINPLNSEGPKVRFRLLSRTDFHSMYESLSDLDKARFRQISYNGAVNIAGVHATNNPFTIGTGVNLDHLVFRQQFFGFDDDPTVGEDGPTLRNWLESIIAPAVEAQGKDLLSPPDPIRGVQDGESRNDAYSMGNYEMDGSKVLLEMRGLRKKFGKQPYTNWVPFARNFIQNAVARNDTLKMESKLASDARKAKSYDFWGGSDL